MIRKFLVFALAAFLTLPCLAQVKAKSCSSGQAAATSWSDDFNRASLGTDWTVNGGGSINSSTVFNFSSGSPGLQYAVYSNAAATFTDNQFSQMQIAQIGGHFIGPAVRMSADGQSFYTLRCNNTASRCMVGRYNSGSWTEMQAIIGTYVPTNGDTIRIEASGTTISVWKCNDGDPCATKVVLGTGTVSWTDGSITTGKPGIHGNYADSTDRLDNWKGGNL